MNALDVDCVGKSFRGRPVLTSASLRAEVGTITALMGRNGSGKSTLLRVAAGVARADYGTIRYDGEVLARPSLARLARRGIFYLPQHAFLMRGLTPRQHCRMASSDAGEVAAEHAIIATGLTAVADRTAGSLSGGELRRAEVAMALARRPRILLADEPLREVAPYDAELLWSVFVRLAADGCAVIITGHDATALLAFADRVTWVVAGTSQDLGTPRDASENDAFRRDYLGVPLCH